MAVRTSAVPRNRVLVFGAGDFVVDTGEHNEHPAVFISRAKQPEAPGESAKREKIPLDSLLSDDIVLEFPTRDQAHTVADALVAVLHEPLKALMLEVDRIGSVDASEEQWAKAIRRPLYGLVRAYHGETEATDAPGPEVEAECNEELIAGLRPTPRICAKCGHGPCRRYEGDPANRIHRDPLQELTFDQLVGELRRRGATVTPALSLPPGDDANGPALTPPPRGVRPTIFPLPTITVGCRVHFPGKTDVWRVVSNDNGWLVLQRGGWFRRETKECREDGVVRAPVQ